MVTVLIALFPPFLWSLRTSLIFLESKDKDMLLSDNDFGNYEHIRRAYSYCRDLSRYEGFYIHFTA